MVNRARDNLFAATSFSGDEHRRFGAGNTLGSREQRLQSWAVHNGRHPQQNLRFGCGGQSVEVTVGRGATRMRTQPYSGGRINAISVLTSASYVRSLGQVT